MQKGTLPFILILVTIPLFFTACAKLGPIEKFATQSSGVTAIADVKGDWQDSYRIRKRFSPRSEWGEPPEQLWKNLDALQSVLSSYFGTMAKVAGTDKSMLNDDLKGTVSLAIQAGALTSEQEAMANRLVTTIAESIIDLKRRQQLREMIENANGAVVGLIDNMVVVLDTDFRNVLIQEVRSIDTVLDLREPGLGEVVFSTERHLLLELREDATDRLESVDQFILALRKIKEGHQDLHKDREALTSPKVREKMAELVAFLKAARSELKD